MLKTYRDKLERASTPPIDFENGLRVQAQISLLETLYIYALDEEGESMNKKYEEMRNGLIKFRDSEKTKKDYFDFIITCVKCLRQGDGLLWSEVNEIIDEVIEK